MSVSRGPEEGNVGHVREETLENIESTRAWCTVRERRECHPEEVWACYRQ